MFKCLWSGRSQGKLHPCFPGAPPTGQRSERHPEVDDTHKLWQGKMSLWSLTWKKAGNASCGEEMCEKEQRVGGQLILQKFLSIITSVTLRQPSLLT